MQGDRAGIWYQLDIAIVYLLHAMPEYHFITSWRVEAPLQDVYDAILESIHWPDWWRGAERVEELEAGDANGIGCVRRYTWKSRLSYQLSFDARTTRVSSLSALEATTTGDLEGVGRWAFAHENGITIVHHEWRVHTTKTWMNLLAPLARPLFIENHHALMQQGAEGIARLLRARLLDVSHAAMPAGAAMGWSKRNPTINWVAAVVAGIAAGIAATLVQLVLWRTFGFPLPDMLFRDTRMAAAIVMGPAILPPHLMPTTGIALTAASVHFALSITYGLTLAPLLSRVDSARAIIAGGLFGLLIFGINMYGFTAIFPWFEASRDRITAIAHVSFGIALSWIYKLWDAKRERFDRGDGDAEKNDAPNARH